MGSVQNETLMENMIKMMELKFNLLAGILTTDLRNRRLLAVVVIGIGLRGEDTRKFLLKKRYEIFTIFSN